MALDGITVSALIYELNNSLIGSRIVKIAQPERDELILTVKNKSKQYRLLISAGASLPLVYLTDNNKQSPMKAPNFCMLLRKHINNARIINIYQPGLERIINIELEHLNELGDNCNKLLVIELMGKHSNIIFINEGNIIIDSIKHVSAQVSSIREVLPGRDYFIPQTITKINPLTITKEEFKLIMDKSTEIFKALYTSIEGISPISAQEVCHRASIDSSTFANTLKETEFNHLYITFKNLIDDIANNNFKPQIIYKNGIPIEFSAIPLTVYNNYDFEYYQSMSQVLETYYREKESITRIRQKTSDLRQLIQTTLNKNYKKYDLQLNQLKDTEKREYFKVYGELITAFGYSAKLGDKSLEALNYYTDEEVSIPLDENLTPIENANKYFERYNKLKRTYEALTTIIKETKEEIDHLESISTALDIASEESDISELKEELIEYGYIKRKSSEKKQKSVSKPLHYISRDGFNIYIGKNNFQNDYITFKQATGNDWWFHAKGIPGSHVIVKSNDSTLPDSTFEDAARLAAYYSKGRSMEKVEIDYTQKKNIKKPSSAKAGFVIYHTNYSLLIEPDITSIKKLS